MFEQISANEERIGKIIVDIAYNIHRQLGPGLLESVYAKCFYHELEQRGVSYVREKNVPIYFNNLKIDDGLRLDCLVEDLVIVEFKAQEVAHVVWHAQLISYLKLSKKRLGFLINFHVPLIKDGIKRIVI